MSLETLTTPNEPDLEVISEFILLPKKFGKTAISDLISMSYKAEEALLDNNCGRIDEKLHEIAADTQLEIALTLADPDQIHTDTRLDLVDSAVEHYRNATQIFTDRQERGVEDPDSIHDVLRNQVRQELHQSYKDLICNNVTPDTREKTLVMLSQKQTTIKAEIKALHEGINNGYYNAQYYNRGYIEALTGLGGEIFRLQTIWEDALAYDKPKIAFLSTTRGGSGLQGLDKKLSRDTHDIITAEQINDTRWFFDTEEVKKSPRSFKARSDALGRYSSKIVFINRNNDFTVR